MQRFKDCPNIWVDGDEFTAGFLGLHWFPSAGSSANKQKYEEDVLNALGRLTHKHFVGWCIISEILELKTRRMIIKPYHPTPADPFNAYATAVDPIAATMEGTTLLDKCGQLPARGKPRFIGTGTGSDTIIEFSPSIFAGVAPAPTGPGSSSDEILLHEMTHGFRQMKGCVVKEPTDGAEGRLCINKKDLDGLHNYEEFVAIVISNMLRSELRQPQLRADHRGFTPLTATLATTAGFKSAFSQFLRNMRSESFRLCQRLGDGAPKYGIKFNPFEL